MYRPVTVTSTFLFSFFFFFFLFLFLFFLFSPCLLTLKGDFVPTLLTYCRYTCKIEKERKKSALIYRFRYVANRYFQLSFFSFFAFSSFSSSFPFSSSSSSPSSFFNLVHFYSDVSYREATLVIASVSARCKLSCILPCAGSKGVFQVVEALRWSALRVLRGGYWYCCCCHCHHRHHRHHHYYSKIS